jgi:hypothetical protein
MKGNPQLLKAISSFLIFILLIQITGCYSFKPISASDPAIYQTGKYRYTIHTKGTVYALENPVISNEILSGKAGLSRTYYKNAIEIYPKSGFEIKIDTLNTISIPLESVAKFTKSKFSIVISFVIPAIVVSFLVAAFNLGTRNSPFL